MQAMVLCAGFGTRLWPLTRLRAKPAVPFLGEPLVARIIKRLRNQGFERITVNLHHQADSVVEALASQAGVRFSPESEVLGTAGGIAQALDRGLLDPSEPLLVVNGKLETDADFRGLLEAHRAHPDDVTLLLAENRRREAFREVFFEGGQVRGFGPGRVPESPAPWCFTGIQVIGPSVLRRLEPRFSDTVRDHYPGLLDAGRLWAARHGGRWWEFSTPERYLGLHWRAWAEFASQQAPAHRSVIWGDPGSAPDGAEFSDCIVLAPHLVPAGRRFHGKILAPAAVVWGDAEHPVPDSAETVGSLVSLPLDLGAVAHSAGAPA